VPEPGNPQALNRYAYVLNNPLKYTDPSGHRYDPGGAYSRKPPLLPPLPGADAANQVVTWMENTANDIVTPIENGSAARAVVDAAREGGRRVVRGIDAGLWGVPSVVGVRGGVYVGADLIVGGDITLRAYTVAFNWRSGELSVFEEKGANIYVGCPRIGEAGVNAVVFAMWGASSNKNLEGYSQFVEGRAQADVVAKAGAVVGGLRQTVWKNGAMEVAVDERSNMPIFGVYGGVTGGGDLVSNAVDVGGAVGESQAMQVYPLDLIRSIFH